MEKVFSHTVMISSFVFSMMLLVEYINVSTSGNALLSLSRNKWRQYIIAAFLGVTPGCLGAFIAFTLFNHRNISLGALVATMVATSGDEAFVMFAMIPKHALLMTMGLFVLGGMAGFLTDLFLKPTQDWERHNFSLHPEQSCKCSWQEIKAQWKNLSLARAVIFSCLLIFIILLIFGVLGPDLWNWKKISFLLVSIMGALIIATVSDHFLDEHLWKHVAKQHFPQIFLWTLLALSAVEMIKYNISFENFVKEHPHHVIASSILLGIIPSSGPHLIYVTMFSKGLIGFIPLLVSSIVQDGHGMIPVLSHSRKLFFIIKFINIIFGLVVAIIASIAF